jgi:hypothetical protein
LCTYLEKKACLYLQNLYIEKECRKEYRFFTNSKSKKKNTKKFTVSVALKLDNNSFLWEKIKKNQILIEKSLVSKKKKVLF